MLNVRVRRSTRTRALSGLGPPVTAELCWVSLPSASLSPFAHKKKKNSFKHALFPSQLTSSAKLSCYRRIPARAEQIASIRPISVHSTALAHSEREHSAHPELEESWGGKKKIQTEPPTTPALVLQRCAEGLHSSAKVPHQCFDGSRVIGSAAMKTQLHSFKFPLRSPLAPQRRT